MLNRDKISNIFHKDNFFKEAKLVSTNNINFPMAPSSRNEFKAFLASDDYKAFSNGVKSLITSLEKWVNDNGLLDDKAKDALAALTKKFNYKFKEKGEENADGDNGEAHIFFTDGTVYLAEIVKLLEADTPLIHRKEQMTNLLNGIKLCSGGILKTLRDALSKLNSDPGSILMSIREELGNEVAMSLIERNKSKTFYVYSGNSVHYGVGLLNDMSESYGVPCVNDPDLPDKESYEYTELAKQFPGEIEKKLTLEYVIKKSLDRIKPALASFIAEYNKLALLTSADAPTLRSNEIDQFLRKLDELGLDKGFVPLDYLFDDMGINLASEEEIYAQLSISLLYRFESSGYLDLTQVKKINLPNCVVHLVENGITLSYVTDKYNKRTTLENFCLENANDKNIQPILQNLFVNGDIDSSKLLDFLAQTPIEKRTSFLRSYHINAENMLPKVQISKEFALFIQVFSSPENWMADMKNMDWKKLVSLLSNEGINTILVTLPEDQRLNFLYALPSDLLFEFMTPDAMITLLKSLPEHTELSPNLLSILEKMTVSPENIQHFLMHLSKNSSKLFFGNLPEQNLVAMKLTPIELLEMVSVLRENERIYFDSDVTLAFLNKLDNLLNEMFNRDNFNYITNFDNEVLLLTILKKLGPKHLELCIPTHANLIELLKKASKKDKKQCDLINKTIFSMMSKDHLNNLFPTFNEIKEYLTIFPNTLLSSFEDDHLRKIFAKQSLAQCLKSTKTSIAVQILETISSRPGLLNDLIPNKKDFNEILSLLPYADINPFLRGIDAKQFAIYISDKDELSKLFTFCKKAFGNNFAFIYSMLTDNILKKIEGRLTDLFANASECEKFLTKWFLKSDLPTLKSKIAEKFLSASSNDAPSTVASNINSNSNSTSLFSGRNKKTTSVPSTSVRSTPPPSVVANVNNSPAVFSGVNAKGPRKRRRSEVDDLTETANNVKFKKI